jgi:large subunit ribosomal protein L1
MKKHGKRYRECLETVGGQTALQEAHPVAAAAELVCQQAKAKFTESVDLALKLNIDPRKSDQLVRGSYSLPHGTGKTVRVVAFAEGDDAKAAEAAGAIEVGGEELAEKIQGGWMEFDVAVAHPSMMRFVGKLGKVLGPKGLMPSPKSGTVTPDVGEAVKEFAGGRIEFRNDAQGNICVSVGKADFQPQQVAENIQAFLDHVQSLRPAAVKGIFMKGATVSTTMGVGLPLQI